jgi:hypothetical protein
MKNNLLGSAPIDLAKLEQLVDQSPELIAWAAPIMFLCVLIEWFVAKMNHHKRFDQQETLASICVGIGNVVIAFFLKFGLFFIIVAIYNLLPWRMSFTWWMLFPCYVLLDFCSYWSHRISHHQRFWWATHVVHHSGAHYNRFVQVKLDPAHQDHFLFACGTRRISPLDIFCRQSNRRTFSVLGPYRIHQKVAQGFRICICNPFQPQGTPWFSKPVH